LSEIMHGPYHKMMKKTRLNTRKMLLMVTRKKWSTPHKVTTSHWQRRAAKMLPLHRLNQLQRLQQKLKNQLRRQLNQRRRLFLKPKKMPCQVDHSVILQSK